MRRHAVVPVLRFALVCALVSAAARTVRADDCSGVLSTCIDDDTFWPHAGSSLFSAVGSGQTLASGRTGFGLVTSYLSRPIVLQLISPGLGSEQDVVNDQVNATFLYAYGVTDRLELDLELPMTLGQGGTGLGPVTGGAGLKDTAVRDLRFGFAFDLVPMEASGPPGASDRGAWGLVARFEASAPTGDEDQFAGERAAVFAPGLAGEWRSHGWFAGAEVGARIRPIAQLLGARIGSQLVTALGVGYEILPRGLLAGAVEAWALPTFAEQGTSTVSRGAYTARLDGSHIVPAEWQVSARSAFARNGELSVELSGGGGIPFSGDLPVTTPRFRFTLGLRWAPTP